MIAKYQFLLLSLIIIFSSSLTPVHSKKVQGWTQLIVPLDTSQYFQYVALGKNGDLWGKANYSDSTLYRYTSDGSWYRYQGEYSSKRLVAVDHNGLAVLQAPKNSNTYYLYYFQDEQTFVYKYYYNTGDLTNIVYGPSNTTWTCDDYKRMRLYNTYNDYFDYFRGYSYSMRTTDCNFAIDKYGLPWTVDGTSLQRWDFSSNIFKTILELDRSGTLHTGQGDGSLYLVTYYNKILKFDYESLTMEEIADVSNITTSTSMFSFYDESNFVIGGKLNLNSTFYNYVLFPNYTEAAANLTDTNELEFIK